MKRLLAIAIALATLPAAATAENYLGVLKPPSTSLTPSGFYSFATAPGEAPAALDGNSAASGVSLKLGYKYSRYLSVEGEFSDIARPADVFSNPARLTSPLRSTGFGIDTVATLPVWGFSFYGRLGAWHGDRMGFGSLPATLLADAGSRGTRWRYGLGVRYDFTKSLGVRAQMERYSSGLATPFAGDADADQFSVGLSWRF